MKQIIRKWKDTGEIICRVYLEGTTLVIAGELENRIENYRFCEWVGINCDLSYEVIEVTHPDFWNRLCTRFQSVSTYGVINEIVEITNEKEQESA